MSVRECTQCTATAQSTGNRCKLRTCVSARYCWRHLITLEGLRIKPSTIPNAGLGLFTTKDRIRNEKLDNYKVGTVRETKREIDRRYGNEVGKYVWCANNANCFDARSTQTNWVRTSVQSHTGLKKIIIEFISLSRQIHKIPILSVLHLFDR
jgi:hypothetical protein